jgi:hypothetical protein
MAQGTVAGDFYSARLLHIAIVGEKKPRRRQLCDETVVLFRARDSANAFKSALRIGKSREHQYRNSRGEIVCWVFAEILVVTHLGSLVEGIEVSSRLHDRVLGKPVSLRTRFHPERSKPQWA